MKRRIINWLLATLGFGTVVSTTGCKVMYDAPHDDFNVKAKVTAKIVNSENEPIKGIQVAAESNTPGYSRLGFTDESGKVTLVDYVGHLDVPAVYNLQITDIDGAENGSYASKSVEVVITEENQVTDGEEGVAYSKDVGAIALENAE